MSKFKVGDKVGYSSIIGEPYISTHTIKDITSPREYELVAWLTDKSGCVSLEALTLLAPKCENEITDNTRKRIDIKEFREKGFLQELNRLFLHPLGMALEVIVDDKGKETLGGVWDYRDDPEGMLFDADMLQTEKAKEKAVHVEELRESKYTDRYATGECDMEGVQVIHR